VISLTKDFEVLVAPIFCLCVYLMKLIQETRRVH